MTAEPAQTVESAGRHRPVVLGVLRSLATIIVLAGLYYLLPQDHLASVRNRGTGEVWHRATPQARPETRGEPLA